MSEVNKKKIKTESAVIEKTKHHKVGDFVCEAEIFRCKEHVDAKGRKISFDNTFEQGDKCLKCGKQMVKIHCLHNPKTGEWKWPEGDN